MMREFDSERAHHQRLVKDYGRLQQRLENLQGEMATLSPTAAGGHRRSASGISNISLESECSISTERSDLTGVSLSSSSLGMYLSFSLVKWELSVITGPGLWI